MSNFVSLCEWGDGWAWGAGDASGINVIFHGPRRYHVGPDSFTVEARDTAGDAFEVVGKADNYDDALALAETVYANREATT